MISRKPSNPFVIGRYAGGRYFCDRTEETAVLINHIINGRDVVLMSPRRMGKTGLIHHLFSQPQIKGTYDTVFVDIYATRSFVELVYLLANAVYDSVKGGMKQKVENFFKKVGSLRVGFRLDAVTGEPSFDLQPGQLGSPNTTLDELFAYLEASPRPVIIAIDEFQQIGDYPETNVEAQLRTLVQKCRNVHFIYAGSRQHALANMFSSPSKPFYQSARMLDLGPIGLETYTEFARELFAERSRDIEAEAVRTAYEKCQGVTWFYQTIMNELFSMTPEGDVARTEMIGPAMENIVSERAGYYQNEMARLSERQKRLLLAIASETEVKEITSADFISRNALGSASSVQSARRGLDKLGLLSVSKAGIRISDIFFAAWLANY